MAVPQQQSPPSRLLQLSGELRNRIYRYAVTGSTDDLPVQVWKSGMPEPELLRTCKLIRAEALPIYYCENHFVCMVYAFDSEVQLRFEQKIMAVNREYQVDFVQLKRTPVRMQGLVNWSNLKIWAQRLHSKELGFLRDSGVSHASPITATPGVGSLAAETILVRGVWDLSRELRVMPWSVVEGLLENVHVALATLHDGWT